MKVKDKNKRNMIIKKLMNIFMKDTFSIILFLVIISRRWFTGSYISLFCYTIFALILVITQAGVLLYYYFNKERFSDAKYKNITRGNLIFIVSLYLFLCIMLIGAFIVGF